MGNVIETESSGSDTEGGNTEQGQSKGGPQERTAGDGMECVDVDDKVRDQVNLIQEVGKTEITKKHEEENVQDLKLEEEEQVPSTFGNYTFGKNSLSPRQLPPKELLIPVKPPKLEGKGLGTGASSGTVGMDIKQKTPKFVPYEPYSCATRSFIKTHAKKPSDSSTTSQGTVISPSPGVDFVNNGPEDVTRIGMEPQNPISKVEMQQPLSPKRDFSQHLASTTLMKERFRMAEKEIAELQTENARLKKLIIDSVLGASAPGVNNNGNGAMNEALQTPSSESVEDLNSTLEVWRSKFQCAVFQVEQLTKETHDLNGMIRDAAEIIKDMKHTCSLTQKQYENINEWLRRTNSWSYAMSDSPTDMQDYYS